MAFLPILFVFQHRAGVRPYTSFYNLAESCVFSKQSLPPFLCDLRRLHVQIATPWRHTFSRSYGIILPSSLTSVLSITLGFSPHPPESVYGTVTCELKLRGFSWKHGINDFMSIRSRHHVSALTGKGICLSSPPTRLNRDIQYPDRLPFSVPPSQQQVVREY